MPATLYFSLFLLSFSISYLFSTIRIALSSLDLICIYINTPFKALSMSFMVAFVVECLKPGKGRIGFFIILLYSIPFVTGTYFSEKELITIAPGVTEIVFSTQFDYIIWATFVPLSLFTSSLFLLFFFRTKERKSISMALLFITIAVCSGLLDWPGFLPQYLTVERGFLLISLLFFYFSTINPYIHHRSSLL